MTYRNRRKIEIELQAYKYLCLFVLGFSLGIWVGRATANYFGVIA